MYTILMSTDKYQINEKDIDSVLNFLKLTDPENATPEMAIALLEYLHEQIHDLSHTNPELLAEMYEKFKKEKRTSN
ncbi:hypothetical protein A3B02_02410 [Candidatus Roizmanbacteria bacterium RIFCSPLOWO2_01_FULL_42_14]|uniref:Uncharacterized protein n=2 Tax=Candidatus Roizmaniibacteriota TaxID=1752723 RepID=A0A1F7JWB6_9BACT|nr:MAG: hypothetical protein A3B02_02410 [Candidatus Roizmanbacteria bacterium RIFCSPLOWO2_01_FULL_42_14]OGK59890.1 MAG: hypothetical protein A3I56_03435 [Candidatus Roizmanbacteria bacterium RIFCSPLOWO2_02_FULL_43_10]